MSDPGPLNVGIIGLGYWGPNYLRTLGELPGTAVRMCCDLDREGLEKVRGAYPEIETTTDYNRLAGDPEIDAAIIVTPPDTHYRLARACLKNGKHILIEKPFTVDSAQARELIELAEEGRRVAMVGHIYKYHPVVELLREYIRSGKLGQVYYLKAERIGLGPIRKQGSALWDLAVHDIYTALHLLDALPADISARGGSYIQENIEDFVDVNLGFPDRVFCSIYASWFAPEKVRKLTVVGSRAMAVFDDTNKAQMLKIYERKIDRGLLNSTPDYRDHQNLISLGRVYSPEIPDREPLKIQVGRFLDRIRRDDCSPADAEEGLRVVRILESAQKSLQTGETVCL